MSTVFGMTRPLGGLEPKISRTQSIHVLPLRYRVGLSLALRQKFIEN